MKSNSMMPLKGSMKISRILNCLREMLLSNKTKKSNLEELKHRQGLRLNSLKRKRAQC